MGCGDDYPTQLHVLQAGLDAPEAECTCECGSPTAVCSTSISATGFNGAAACTQGVGTASVNQNQCYNQVQNYTHSVSLGAASSSCAAGTVDEIIPATSWTISNVACGGEATLDACAETDEICMPIAAGFGDALCVSQDGDRTCPAGYPEKTLYFDGVADTRECPDSCSCAGEGATCATSVARYTGSSCTGNLVIPSTSVVSGASACVINDSVESIRPGPVTLQDAWGLCTGLCESLWCGRAEYSTHGVLHRIIGATSSGARWKPGGVSRLHRVSPRLER